MSRRNILCLHGTQTSSQFHEWQLGPIMERLQSEMQDLSFLFLDGPVKAAHPPKALEGIYDGPCYTWVKFDKGYDDTGDTDDGNELIRFGRLKAGSFEDCFAFLDGVLATEGPFDGIFCFSLGGVAMTAFLLHRMMNAEPWFSPSSLLKFAVLFSCPPLPDDYPMDVSRPISLPCLLVTGTSGRYCCNDIDKTLRSWDRKHTLVLQHPGGHMIPRDGKTVGKIVEQIRKVARIF